MKSLINGTNTASNKIEVSGIFKNGISLFIDKEYFLPFKDFPWFEHARIDEVFDVRILNDEHIRWDKLDVDLEFESIRNSKIYPVIMTNLLSIIGRKGGSVSSKAKIAASRKNGKLGGRPKKH